MKNKKKEKFNNFIENKKTVRNYPLNKKKKISLKSTEEKPKKTKKTTDFVKSPSKIKPTEKLDSLRKVTHKSVKKGGKKILEKESKTTVKLVKRPIFRSKREKLKPFKTKFNKSIS